VVSSMHVDKRGDGVCRDRCAETTHEETKHEGEQLKKCGEKYTGGVSHREKPEAPQNKKKRGQWGKGYYMRGKEEERRSKELGSGSKRILSTVTKTVKGGSGEGGLTRTRKTGGLKKEKLTTNGSLVVELAEKS